MDTRTNRLMETQRQTDGQTDKQTHRWTERHTDGHKDKWKVSETKKDKIKQIKTFN